MSELLTVVGSLIVALSFTPYLIDTIKKRVKPRLATWSTWGLLGIIATVAEISAHAYTAAVLTGTASTIDILIVIFALRNGDRGYGWLDATCQAISIIGLVLWLVSSNPTWAIAFAIIADLFAAIPTYYHAWIEPFEESWHPFALFAFGATLAIAGISSHKFNNFAFPLYYLFSAISIGLEIYLRQKIVKHSKK